MPGVEKKENVGESKEQPFATAGILEIGLNLGFAYTSEDGKTEHMTVYDRMTTVFDLGLYMGYFLTKRFVLGVYAQLPVTYERSKALEKPVTSIEFALIAAPGFAMPIYKESLFFYGDALVGFQAGKVQTGDVEGQTIQGVFGGELGLKLKLADHAMLRVGIRPMYHLGRMEMEETTMGFSGTMEMNRLDLEVRAGFSTYF
jgi:hypothetical protein